MTTTNPLYKYLGFTLASIGIVVIFFYVKNHPTNKDLVSAWLIWSELSISQVFPLVGLAIGLSLNSFRLICICLLGFFIGFLLSIIYYEKLWIWFSSPINVTQHLYLTIPISALFSALVLILPSFLQKYIILPSSIIVGSMLAITTKLTDPTLHNPIIIKLGFFVGFWIVVSVILIIRPFYKTWFQIPIRILGSWLLASSLLYGGTILAYKYKVFTPQNIKSSPTQKEKEENLLIPDFTN